MQSPSTRIREENKYIIFDETKQKAKQEVIQASLGNTTIKYNLEDVF